MNSIGALTIAAFLSAAAISPSATAGTFKTLYTFTGRADGMNPYGGLIALGNTLYGTTELAIEGNCGPGGTGPCGSVYAIDAKNGKETTLHTFTGGTDGTFAITTLLLSNNLLYGTTLRGGGTGCSSSGCGIVFSVDPATHAETVLYRFAGGSDGANPRSPLISLNGLLYGTTSTGAGTGCFSTGCGTIYSVDPTTGAETVLYSFTGGSDGGTPIGAIAYQGTVLYGVTQMGGGDTGLGTLFSFDVATNTFTVLHIFTGGADGSTPSGGVIYQNGLLYGTTQNGGQGCGTDGCGTVYQFDPGSETETVLYRFPGKTKGEIPFGTITFYNNDLYGTTFAGGIKGCNGKEGCGTIFKLDPATGKAKVLYSFTNAADGLQPEAGLVLSGKTLYGTTLNGGTLPRGTVFSLKP